MTQRFGVEAVLDLGARALGQAAEAWAVNFDKSRVVRRRVGLGFDPGDFDDEAFDDVSGYVAAFERRAARAMETRSGLRWQHEGEALLFQMTRVVNAPYADFTARVDIAAAIRTMNDYVGGAWEVVSRDPRGRVVRQAERNLYLPQPNWVAFSGGAFIDVCKLEHVQYAGDRCRIAWRTVHSPNGSAVLDDGSVRFERLDHRRTRVTVCGLQQFTLPPFWAAAEPWLLPVVKNALAEEAYRRFFTVTLDNFEAAYEGRDVRIGREPTGAAPPVPAVPSASPWAALRTALPARQVTALLPALPAVPVASLLRLAREQVVEPLAGSAPDRRVHVDDDGFAHVPAPRYGSR